MTRDKQLKKYESIFNRIATKSGLSGQQIDQLFGGRFNNRKTNKLFEKMGYKKDSSFEESKEFWKKIGLTKAEFIFIDENIARI